MYKRQVCGSVEERHGCVLAKNYAAKAFGVSTGEAILSLIHISERVPDFSIMTNSVANNGNPFGSADYARKGGRSSCFKY